MKNCLILGSGRSGTSMIGGILHDAGYFMGDDLYPPRRANPKGFFENWEVNEINENILAAYRKNEFPLSYLAKKIQTGLKKVKHVKRLVPNVKTTVYRPGRGQWWLFSLPANTAVTNCPGKWGKKIKRLTARTPFAYKDPRLCYTLPVWARFLYGETVLICIFRQPDVTVESMLNECRTVDYLEHLNIDRQNAYEVWINMYSHILETHRRGLERCEFIFLHYDQVYDGSSLDRLSEALGVLLNTDFVDKQLKRTRPLPGETIPPNAWQIYTQLCQLAGYHH